MPTLGFLKKKRTKDSSGSNELSSPVKDKHTTSPIKTNFEFPKAEPLTASKSAPQQASAQGAAQDDNTLTHAKTAMPMYHAQQPYAASAGQQQGSYQQQNQQNIPSISNLLQNNAQNNSVAANGQAVTPSSDAGAVHKAQTQAAQAQPVRSTKGKYTLTDFAIQRTLGTGSFGRVHLVQSKHNQRFYAMKVLKKAQVVKMKQVEHTNDERRMLQRVKHPFLITLWGTFQDSKNLYMVMDFVEGGELFSLLRKSQVRSTHII